MNWTGWFCVLALWALAPLSAAADEHCRAVIRWSGSGADQTPDARPASIFSFYDEGGRVFDGEGHSSIARIRIAASSNRNGYTAQRQWLSIDGRWRVRNGLPVASLTSV